VAEPTGLRFLERRLGQVDLRVCRPGAWARLKRRTRKPFQKWAGMRA
jgi:hypothetical protein